MKFKVSPDGLTEIRRLQRLEHEYPIRIKQYLGLRLDLSVAKQNLKPEISLQRYTEWCSPQKKLSSQELISNTDILNKRKSLIHISLRPLIRRSTQFYACCSSHFFFSSSSSSRHSILKMSFVLSSFSTHASFFMIHH